MKVYISLKAACQILTALKTGLKWDTFVFQADPIKHLQARTLVVTG